MFSRLLLVTLVPCVAGQIPGGISKLICKFASEQEVEDMTVGAVCDEVTKLFPSIQFDPDCKTVVEELWDTGLALWCPSEEKSLVSVDSLNGPIPPGIEKSICEFAESPEIEKDVGGFICEKVKELFPSIKFDPDCETIFDAVYEAGLKAVCKKNEAAFAVKVNAILGSHKLEASFAMHTKAALELPTSPELSPQDLEQLICKFASKHDVEDHAVEAVCDEIHQLFPSIKFHPDCKTMLEEIWDVAVLLCPKVEQFVV